MAGDKRGATSKSSKSKPATLPTRANAANPPSKPLYSIFNKKPKPPPQVHVVEDDVIEIADDVLECEDTTAAAAARLETNSPRGVVALTVPDLFVRDRKRKRSLNGDSGIPYPTRELQHVRGPQSTFSAPAPPLQRRTRGKQQVLPECASSTTPSDIPTFRHQTHDISTFPPIQASHILTDSMREDYINNIPEDFRRHPAVSRLLGSTPPHPSEMVTSIPTQKIWADKWRPRCAEEVLGNEQKAMYLREWLRALEIQIENSAPPVQSGKQKGKAKSRGDEKGTKRPRVIRAVMKKKGRKKLRIDSDEDDWIVNDDESIPEWDASSEDEPELGPRSQPLIEEDNSQSSETARHSPPNQMISTPDIPSLPSRFDGTLTNTILLVGPPGCGKTAAVYACADELNWEVFEVYPGIGKRNSASLDQLIGDVGKNHLVRKGQGNRSPPAAPGTAFAGFPPKFKMGMAANTQAGHDFGFVTATNALQDIQPNGTDLPTPSPGVIPKIRQSLVLLEEVDILFKEDASFWPGVVNLIKDCKRPVIMTCSDVTLIPTGDLPLQTILTFDACPVPLAVSYLQSMCIAESCLVKQGELCLLYQSTYELNPVDDSDTPINALNATVPKPDLRCAINNLQFWCSRDESTAEAAHRESVDSLEDMIDWGSLVEIRNVQSGTAVEDIRLLRQRAAQHAELESYVDSHLTRNPLDTAEALKSYEPSPDDEIGHRILFLVSSPHVPGEEKSIADAIMRLSRGVDCPLVFKAANTFRRGGLFRARVGYQSQMMDVLGNILPVSAPLIPRPSVFVDYEPWIRIMVAIDDWEAERNAERGMERTRRVTRSRQSTVYERYISLSPAQLEVLGGTKLV